MNNTYESKTSPFQKPHLYNTLILHSAQHIEYLALEKNTESRIAHGHCVEDLNDERVVGVEAHIHHNIHTCIDLLFNSAVINHRLTQPDSLSLRVSIDCKVLTICPLFSDGDPLGPRATILVQKRGTLSGCGEILQGLYTKSAEVR